jgi:hypothetical protein
MLSRPSGYCWPWAHEYDITTGLSVPMFDPGGRGELWRCKKCPKTKAK